MNTIKSSNLESTTNPKKEMKNIKSSQNKDTNTKKTKKNKYDSDSDTEFVSSKSTKRKKETKKKNKYDSDTEPSNNTESTNNTEPSNNIDNEINAIINGVDIINLNTKTGQVGSFKDCLWSYDTIVQSKNNIILKNYNLSIGETQLLDSSNLTLTKGKCYGLIGDNGVGKTTLGRQFTHLCDYSSVSVLYVEQILSLSEKEPVEYILYDVKPELRILEDQEQKLIELLERQDETMNIEKILSELSTIQESIEMFHNDKSEIMKILNGLGFSQSDLSKPSNTFSGGWSMRLSLARALYMKPDFLILDESSNHLDLEAIIWLSDYLMNWDRIILIISHNIGFINDTCNNIIHIENMKIHQYKGNYDQYKEQYDNDYKVLVSNYERYLKELKVIKNKSTPTVTQEWIKANFVPEPIKKKIFKTNEWFPNSSTDISSPLVTANDLSFSYGDNKIVDKISFGIRRDEKIILVGLNGSGKSTLAKLISKELDPTDGDVSHNRSIRLGYYHQDLAESFIKDQTTVDGVVFGPNKRSYSKNIGDDIKTQCLAQKYLGMLGLNNKYHDQSLNKLSGGQRARVGLANMMFKDPQMLILDEPTNHLDNSTSEGLIDALEKYNGGMLLITHDSYLIERLIDTGAKIWYLNRETHKINEHIGSYAQYRRLVLSK